MPTRLMSLLVLLASLAACSLTGAGTQTLAVAAPRDRITIVVDAFGVPSGLRRDWGFAALVEYGSQRILFDTGNNAEGFAHNVRALGIDLKRLDAVVISHRHGDHTDGLRHLLAVNPQVRIYVPDDEYFGGQTPPAFFLSAVPSLPPEMRYFGGEIPGSVPHGSAWRGNFVRVASTTEIGPGVRLVRNLAPPGASFSETPELSLVLDTPEGPVLVVGCSHPGIERILSSLGDPGSAGPPVRLIAGGLHLVTTPSAEIDRVIAALRETWRVVAVAPGHCTGELAFARLQQAFGLKYVYGGVGTSIHIGPE